MEFMMVALLMLKPLQVPLVALLLVFVMNLRNAMEQVMIAQLMRSSLRVPFVARLILITDVIQLRLAMESR
jgi:hypothetical protein